MLKDLNFKQVEGVEMAIAKTPVVAARGRVKMGSIAKRRTRIGGAGT